MIDSVMAPSMWKRNNTPAIDRYNELKRIGQTDSVEFLSLKTQAWKSIEATWKSDLQAERQLDKQSDDELSEDDN